MHRAEAAVLMRGLMPPFCGVERLWKISCTGCGMILVMGYRMQTRLGSARLQTHTTFIVWESKYLNIRAEKEIFDGNSKIRHLSDTAQKTAVA